MATSTPTTISLSNLSRYKDTPVFQEGDEIEFALFEPLPEFFEPRDDYRIHRVKMNEIGFLDLLAVQYYGHGHEKLWWVIALANAIVDPEIDMYPGMALAIPPRSVVAQFLSRDGNVAAT